MEFKYSNFPYQDNGSVFDLVSAKQTDEEASYPILFIYLCTLCGVWVKFSGALLYKMSFKRLQEIFARAFTHRLTPSRLFKLNLLFKARLDSGGHRGEDLISDP